MSVPLGEFAEKVALGVTITLTTSALVIMITKFATKVSFSQMTSAIVKAIITVKGILVEIANFFLDRLSG